MPDVPIGGRNFRMPLKPFKNRDVEAIKGSEYVTDVIAGNILNNIVIKHGWRSENVMGQMVPHTYFPMDKWQLDRGRFYTTAEERGRAMVCVVGSDVA